MKTRLFYCALFAGALLTLAAWSVPASAHGYRSGPRVTFGFAFGGPLYYGPRYYAPYYSPYYYYPPYPAVVGVPYSPPAPTTYIERDAVQSAPVRPAGYWYYCADSQGYYPYVKECAGGWQQVSPQPPG